MPQHRWHPWLLTATLPATELNGQSLHFLQRNEKKKETTHNAHINSFKTGVFLKDYT